YRFEFIQSCTKHFLIQHQKSLPAQEFLLLLVSSFKYLSNFVLNNVSGLKNSFIFASLFHSSVFLSMTVLNSSFLFLSFILSLISFFLFFALFFYFLSVFLFFF